MQYVETSNKSVEEVVEKSKKFVQNINLEFNMYS